MAEHVVVPTETLDELRKWLAADDGQKVKVAARALLDQAVAVEQGSIDGTWGYRESDHAFISGEGRYYREVES